MLPAAPAWIKILYAYLIILFFVQRSFHVPERNGVRPWWQ